MSQDIPLNTTITRKNLERKIRELQSKKHLPEDMVALVTEVAKLQLEAEDKIRFDDLPEQVLPQKVIDGLAGAVAHAQGAPWLAHGHFPLDMAVTAELARAVLDVFSAKVPLLASFADEIRQALDAGPLFLKNACEDLLTDGYGKRESEESVDVPEENRGSFQLPVWEKEHPEAPRLLAFVLRSAMMPSLSVAARLVGELRGIDSVWQHGHCPVCGGLPLIGRLVGNEGLRTHTCSFCSFEYRVPRIGCPFCLTEAHDGSEYLSSDQEPGFLVDVCKSCNNYIKIADFRQFDRPWNAMLDDLASLTLDLSARQMGYTRPTFSAWGF